MTGKRVCLFIVIFGIVMLSVNTITIITNQSVLVKTYNFNDRSLYVLDFVSFFKNIYNYYSYGAQRISYTITEIGTLINFDSVSNGFKSVINILIYLLNLVLLPLHLMPLFCGAMLCLMGFPYDSGFLGFSLAQINYTVPYLSF